MRLFTFTYNHCDFEFVVAPNAIPFEIIDKDKFLIEVFFRLIYSQNPRLLNGELGTLDKQSFYLEKIFYNQDNQKNKKCTILLISPGQVIQSVEIQLNETERTFKKLHPQIKPIESECDPTTHFPPQLIATCKEGLPQLNARHEDAIKYISYRPSTGPRNEVLPLDQMTAQLEFTNTKRRLLSVVKDNSAKINAHRDLFVQALEAAKKAINGIDALTLEPDSLKVFTNLQQSLRVDLDQTGHLAKLDAAAAVTQHTEITSKGQDIPEQIDVIFNTYYARWLKEQDNISEQKQPILKAIYNFAKNQSTQIKQPNDVSQRLFFNKRFGPFGNINDHKVYSTTFNNLNEFYRNKSFKELEQDIQKLIDSYDPHSLANKIKNRVKIASDLTLLTDAFNQLASSNPNFVLNDDFTFQFVASAHKMEEKCAETKKTLIKELNQAANKLVKDNSESIDQLGATTSMLISHIYKEIESTKAILIQCKMILTHVDKITAQSKKLMGSIAESLHTLRSQQPPEANAQYPNEFSEALAKNEEQKLRLIADLEAQETVIKSIFTSTTNISRIDPQELTLAHLECLDTFSKQLIETSRENGELLEKFKGHQKQSNIYLSISNSLERRVKCNTALDDIDQVALERTSAYLSQCLQDVEAHNAAEAIERQLANFKAEFASAKEELDRTKRLEDSIIQQLTAAHVNVSPVTDELFKQLREALTAAETHKTQVVRLQQMITETCETAIETHAETVRLCRVWVAKIESPDEWERHVVIGGSKLEPHSTIKNPKGIRLFHDALKRQQAEPQAPAALLNQPGSMQEYYANLDAAVLAKLAKDKDAPAPKSTWITNGRQAMRVLNELKRLAETRRIKFSLTRRGTTQDFYDALALLHIDKARQKLELIKREAELHKLVGRQPYVMPESLFDRKAFADQIRREQKRKSKQEQKNLRP